ncbi:large ribosomal subunit protein eL37-like [Callithrix jacchus]|uniref:60S ribosomal protein L37-like n=1 Tax=Callithrix jacchus TaxID=9483 RepID=UPI00159D6002|nr:60S ribosomal protein L37-like [Callithrix jacchus]
MMMKRCTHFWFYGTQWHNFLKQSITGRWSPPQKREGEGKSSFGKRHGKMHTLCHRCGSEAYHLQTWTCGKCGHPAKRKRKYNWSAEAERQNITGTGHVRHLKIVYRRFRHGFHEGTTPQPKRAAVATSSSPYEFQQLVM